MLALETIALASKVSKKRPRARAGFIFTLHHVRPPSAPVSQALNGHLEITPQYLNDVIETLKQEGFEFIKLSEVQEALSRASHERPFAVFTLDDGYRNNVDYALPVFEKHNVPATIFVNPAFAERTACIWWELLSLLLSRENQLSFDFGAGEKLYRTADIDEKIAFFDRYCAYLWDNDEATAIEALEQLARKHHLDPLALTDELTLSIRKIKDMANHPLIGFGAHGKHHLAIARLSDTSARHEMEYSLDWLEKLTGKRPKTFAYPYGDRRAVSKRDQHLAQQLGIDLAVTTQPGMIRTDANINLSALPRVSLNGYFQKRRYALALASGIAFRWLKR